MNQPSKKQKPMLMQPGMLQSLGLAKTQTQLDD